MNRKRWHWHLCWIVICCMSCSCLDNSLGSPETEQATEQQEQASVRKGGPVPVPAPSPEPERPETGAREEDKQSVLAPIEPSEESEAPAASEPPAPAAASTPPPPAAPLEAPREMWPGRFLFVGINGPNLDASTKALLREIRPGGVVLLKGNITNESQTADLCAQIKDAVGLGDHIADLPLIAVDQEGGRVNRLKLPGAPSAREMAANGDPREVRQTARGFAVECRSRGIAIVLAPVLDIDRPGASKVIKDRAFGTDANTVAAMGIAFAQGVMQEGVIPVAKHFPGHGSARQDSHKQLAVLAEEGDDLAATLQPFETASALRIPMIMTGHIACPTIDPSNIPASCSDVLLQGVIRKMWGYDGVLVTDDMNMGAIGMPPGDAAVLALQAGNDAVMYCDPDPARIRAICRAIESAMQDGTLSTQQLAASARRLDALQDWIRASNLLHAHPENLLVARASTKADLTQVPEPQTQPPVGHAKPETPPATPPEPAELLEPVHVDVQADTAPKTEAPRAASQEPASPKPSAQEPVTPAQYPEAPSSEKRVGPQVIFHEVKKGDTLTKIAKKYEVSVESIQGTNGLDDDRITIGQKLKITRFGAPAE